MVNHNPLSIMETNERDALRAGDDFPVKCPECGAHYEVFTTDEPCPVCEEREEEEEK